MPVIAAYIASGLLACLAVFQIALIAGAPLGRFAWGGHNDVLPRQQRINSGGSVILYALFGIIILDTVSQVSLLPNLVATIATYVLTAFFFVGFVLNALSRSPSERALMAPLNLVLAALCLFVAVTGHLVH
jgi:hypothetical protein